MRSLFLAGLIAASAVIAQSAPASAQSCPGNAPCAAAGGHGAGPQPAFRGGPQPAFHGGPQTGFRGGPSPGFHGGPPNYANNGWHGGGNWNNGGAAAAAVGGLAAGAIVGGALASQGPYYSGNSYYGAPAPDYVPGPSYSEDQSATAAMDPVAYCEAHFRSYDPASGTYLGYDGLRHPCS
jgi:hypothetical protein